MNTVPTTTIAILAGGTGGHVFPAQSLAERLVGVQLIWLGRAGGLEQEVAERLGAEFVGIKFTSPRKIISLLPSLWQLWICYRQIGALFRIRKPDLAIGFGGYLSVPGALVALRCKIPLIIHEQNWRAGLANRLLSLWSDRQVTAFPETFAKKPATVMLGNPLRRQHGLQPKGARQVDALTQQVSERRVLILGGSQGARSLNLAVPRALKRLLSAAPDLTPLCIRHFCGRGNLEQTALAYSDSPWPVTVEVFSDSMPIHYEWADLVVCRAGAITLAELAHYALPSILVPLASASDNHQLLNARWFADNGAVGIVEDNDKTDLGLAEELSRLLTRHHEIGAMSVAMSKLAHKDAAEKFACLARQLLATPVS